MKHHTWNKVASSWKDKLHFTIIRKFSICWMKYTMSLKDYHFNESYWVVLSNGTVYYAVQGGSNFWVCGWNPMVWPFKWKLLSSTFLWYYLSRCLNSSWVVWLHPYLVHILTEHSLELSQVKVVSSKHSHRSSGDIFFVQIKVELCLSTKRVYYTQLAPKNKNRLCNSK